MRHGWIAPTVTTVVIEQELELYVVANPQAAIAQIEFENYVTATPFHPISTLETELYSISATYQPQLTAAPTAPFTAPHVNDTVHFTVLGFPTSSTTATLFNLSNGHNYGTIALIGGAGSLDYVVTLLSQMRSDLVADNIQIYAQDNAPLMAHQTQDVTIVNTNI